MEELSVSVKRAYRMAAAKCKREALGEVTNKSKLKLQQNIGSLKQGGYEKETIALAIKKSAPTTLTTTPGVRVPLADRCSLVPSFVIPTCKIRTSAIDKEIPRKDAPADNVTLVDEEKYEYVPLTAFRLELPFSPSTPF